MAILTPVLAGIAFLAANGAPLSYVIVNLGALAIALLYIRSARGRLTPASRRVTAYGMLAILVAPLVAGPEIDGVRRWIELGPVVLHAGMFTIPSLAVLCAGDERNNYVPIGLAIAAASFQPDAANAAALCGACFAFACVLRSLAHAALAAASGAVAVHAFLAGDVAPQRFVEHVLLDAWRFAPAVSLVLATAMLLPVFILLRHESLAHPARSGLAGALIGYIAIALVGNYPTPLVGYGASSILGLGIALAILGRRTANFRTGSTTNAKEVRQ